MSLTLLSVNGEKEVYDLALVGAKCYKALKNGETLSQVLIEELTAAVAAIPEVPAIPGDVTTDPIGSLMAVLVVVAQALMVAKAKA